MTTINFLYWIQGFFELNPNVEVSFNETQTQIIKNHINLVKTSNNISEIGFSVIYWLDGFLEDKNVLDVNETSKIKSKVNDCFKHEIDPLDNDSDKLNEIHGFNPNTPQGNPPSPGHIWTIHGWTKKDELLRC